MAGVSDLLKVTHAVTDVETHSRRRLEQSVESSYQVTAASQASPPTSRCSGLEHSVALPWSQLRTGLVLWKEPQTRSQGTCLLEVAVAHGTVLVALVC